MTLGLADVACLCWGTMVLLVLFNRKGKLVAVWATRAQQDFKRFVIRANQSCKRRNYAQCLGWMRAQIQSWPHQCRYQANRSSSFHLFSRFFSFMSLIWFLTVIKILSAENKNSLLWILILRCCPRQSQFQLSGNETQRQMEFLGVLAASQVNVSSLEEPLQALCQDRSVHWTRRTEGEGAALAQTSNVELKKVYNYSDKV